MFRTFLDLDETCCFCFFEYHEGGRRYEYFCLLLNDVYGNEKEIVIVFAYGVDDILEMYEVLGISMGKGFFVVFPKAWIWICVWHWEREGRLNRIHLTWGH